MDDDWGYPTTSTTQEPWSDPGLHLADSSPSFHVFLVQQAAATGHRPTQVAATETQGRRDHGQAGHQQCRGHAED